MKIRQGFVSNSSSSSFVIVASKKAYDNEYSKLGAFEKDLITWASENTIIDDKACVVIQCESGENGNTVDDYNVGEGHTGYVKGIEPEEEDNWDEIIEEFVSKLRKSSKCYFNSRYS